MPTFATLSPEQIAQFKTRQNHTDLTAYLEALSGLEVGAYLSITLGEGDNQRTVKRRATIAATSLGKKLRWKRERDAGVVVCEVVA